jgi:hypothetical protein
LKLSQEFVGGLKENSGGGELSDIFDTV